MALLREPLRLPDKWFLIMRKKNSTDTVRIEISEAEHALSQQACEDKIISEGRLPPGQWEHNSGGLCRLGGVWTFAGTANGDLEVNDAYLAPNGRLIVNVFNGSSLLELRSEVWAITREISGGLTVRKKTDNSQPKSVSIENGEITIKDLSLIEDDLKGA